MEYHPERGIARDPGARHTILFVYLSTIHVKEARLSVTFTSAQNFSNSKIAGHGVSGRLSMIAMPLWVRVRVDIHVKLIHLGTTT